MIPEDSGREPTYGFRPSLFQAVMQVVFYLAISLGVVFAVGVFSALVYEMFKLGWELVVW